MEHTLDTFKQQQNKTVKLLSALQDFLQQGEAVGVKIDVSLINKLKSAIGDAQDGKLKVALIGGFSEGKTSIAAAWMERLDQSMSISQQESSSEVAIYNVSDDLQLIDTPGLFGFKEKVSADTAELEKYKDITKKYVSEAHLVLYVMNSTNPVKESHKDDLNWLMRDLNILPRTVFVLSRFDEVADVEDEWEYNENYKVKSGNITQRLQEMVGLTSEEVAELSIVAVAANPFDMGSDYWLENIEHFKKLSHIALLQKATHKKINSNGGIAEIAVEAKNSIIRDVLNKELPASIERDEKIGKEVTKLADVVNVTKNKLESTQGSISSARTALREFVTRYFTDLIMQVEGTDLQTFNQFFQREIGDKGAVMTSKLQNEFDRHLKSANLQVQSMKIGFEQEVNHFNDALLGLGKQGMKYIVKSNMINNASILAARDGVKTVAKFVGVDLGKMLSFKPWGAVNLAKGVNGALVVVGIALEAWDSYKQHEREEAFRKTVTDMVSDFNQQREEILGLINSGSFNEQFFPKYVELENEVDSLGVDLEERKQQREDFHAWRLSGENIQKEFECV
ncbi:MAG: LeoA/HP0731 family dynamin-like GTPase [Gammaproteobacteria bacterium]|nr:LeoA/HP0731 family dynamin-like GTPase [Gammaproteobacteria bacterium]